MLFVISEDMSHIERIESQSFITLDVWERKHIQEWVRNYPEMLGEDLLIVSMEFDRFEGSKDRLDLLAIDREGNLVVVELKRDLFAGYADLQSIRYAAMVSTMTVEQLLAHYSDYHKKTTNKEASSEELQSRIDEFVEFGGFEELSSRPRIILCSEGFSQEITTTVLWLRGFDLDISCIRITPHRLDSKIVLVPEKIIPLKESEEYLTGIQEKEEKRQESRVTTTLDDICDKADSENIGEDFRKILRAAQNHNLYPRVWKKSVMYAPPENRRRCLFTVWLKSEMPEKGSMALIPEAFSEFYPVDEETVVSLYFGFGRYNAADEGATDRFLLGPGSWLRPQESTRRRALVFGGARTVAWANALSMGKPESTRPGLHKDEGESE